MSNTSSDLVKDLAEKLAKFEDLETFEKELKTIPRHLRSQLDKHLKTLEAPWRTSSAKNEAQKIAKQWIASPKSFNIQEIRPFLYFQIDKRLKQLGSKLRIRHKILEEAHPTFFQQHQIRIQDDPKSGALLLVKKDRNTYQHQEISYTFNLEVKLEAQKFIDRKSVV